MTQQIDLSLGKDIVCEKCSNYTFQEVMMFKKFSAIATGTGKPAIAPIPTFACVACGWVNAEFLPESHRITEAKDPNQLELAL